MRPPRPWPNYEEALRELRRRRRITERTQFAAHLIAATLILTVGVVILVLGWPDTVWMIVGAGQSLIAGLLYREAFSATRDRS